MKVYISADMEGVAVLCHDVQVDQKGLDYPRARELMTEEVQAAIDGARSGGADEILICDAHDTGRNLLVEHLDQDVEVIQGNPYDLGMMSGISRDFDACFQIGYHAMRDTHAGVLGHTYSFDVAELRLNGIIIGESGFNAAIAGHFGVPVVLVSGDAHAVRQAKGLIKNVIGVATKEGVGLYATRTLTPARARDLIRKGAKDALEKMEEIAPLSLKKPIQLEVEFTRPLMAEYTAHIPLVKRKDMRTVSFKAADMVEAFNVFNVMLQVADSAKNEGPL